MCSYFSNIFVTRGGGTTIPFSLFLVEYMFRMVVLKFNAKKGRSGQGAAVEVGMLRGGGDSKILVLQDVSCLFKISKIPGFDRPRNTKIPRCSKVI